MSELLSIQGLDYSLPDGKPILGGVDLGLESGQKIWIAGPSGGGKTTLLRLINRLLSPSRGRLRLEGRDYDNWPITALRRRLAMLTQSPVMLSGSVGHNLTLPFRLKAAGGADPPGPEELRAMLDRLGLEDLKPERGVEGLSLGQSQRIGLGRLLLMRPRALLLDEPLASLDEDSRALVQREAAQFAAQGGAVIMVSHIPPTDHTYLKYILSGGRLLSSPEGGAA